MIEVHMKIEELKELISKLGSKIEDLESQIGKKARDPEVDQLIKEFDSLKVSDTKLDDLKKAVDNISVASGSKPPQPMFDWRDKEVPGWKEYLRDPSKFKE